MKVQQKKAFENSDKTKIQVDRMYKKYYSQMYYEDKNVQIISLPYISNNLKFKMIMNFT